MSLVGPRPELRRYVEMFRADHEVILSMRPGITDLASVKYSDESERLARAADPKREYIERILPEKIRLAQQYSACPSLAVDAVLLAKTILMLMS